MHKYKRVLISTIALLLCIATLFSVCFADGYTQQQATGGYPRPPVFSTGGSGSSKTTYNSCIIVGYRFTCYRSTDYDDAVKAGITGKELDAYLTKHDGQGIQLGHSINIMLNAVNSNGDSRIDYANGYEQTGQYSPHMLITAEQDDLLNRIKTAQSEITSSTALGDDKVTHSTKFDFMLTQFSGGKGGWKNGHYAGGYLYSDSTACSTFTFTAPLYSHIENSLDPTTTSSRLLASSFSNTSDRNPLTIYSGYYSKDEDLKFLNQRGGEESNNMYTYIYGWQYSSQYGTSYDLKGSDKSDIPTISDIDYEDPTPNNLKDGNEVRPFNALPTNVCNAGDETSWVNRNASLVATLCGLQPVYGEVAKTEQEFGLFDYIVVEPIYSVYYWQIRYFLTCSDMALISAESMYEAKGNKKDCWYTVYHGGYTWFDIAGLFPASYGTFIYTEESFFGVDGVFNATVERGYEKNAFTAKNKFGLAYAVDQSSLSAACTKNDPDNDGQRENPTTHAFVFTNSSGYTMFTGGTDAHSTQERVWYEGRSSMFIAPYVAAQSLLGTGIWMSGASDPNNTHEYKIVYHANPNNGQDPARDVTKTITVSIDSDIKIADYISGINSNVFPNNKIQSGFWTISAGNGYGIADNALGSITTVYDTNKSPATQSNWKISAGTAIPAKYAEEFFATYGQRVSKTVTEVHLYAAWNTKMLVTTLNRTYDDASAQTIQAATAYGGNFMNNNKVPTAISIVQTDNVSVSSLTASNIKKVIPLTRAEGQDGYMWFPSKDSDSLMSSTSKYYIVYSFTENTITTSNISTANLVDLLKNNKSFSGFMCYRSQNALVEWKYNTNLFYFDFYTYEIQAPNCNITLTNTSYPGKPTQNLINTTSYTAANSLTAIIARGSSVQYSVTPSSSDFSFNIGHNIGDTTKWANDNNNKGHLKSDSAADFILADSNSSLTATDEMVSHTNTVVLGKELHKYVVTSGYKIIVTPRLDGVAKAPFEDYHVTILNTATNQTFHYKYKPTESEKTQFGYLATSDGGVVTQGIAREGTFYILVSTTDQTGTSSMSRVATVTTSNANSNNEIQLFVDYYTTEANIQSQSGANHSNTKVTFTVTDGSGTSEIAVVSPTNALKTGAHDCGTAYYTTTKVISVNGAPGYSSGLTKVIALRTTAPDWYLVAANSTTAGTTKAETVSSDAFITNETANGLDYTWTRTVSSKYIINYNMAPYHYISFVLDDVSRHYADMMPTCNTAGCGTPTATCKCLPNGYDITISNNGTYCLRGKYNSNLTSSTKNANNANYRIGNIISTNKTHATGTNDIVTLTYNKDYSTTTVLRYYTLSTSADKGYTKTNILSASNSDMGSTAYILQMLEHQHNYLHCVSGNTTALSFDFNETIYKTTATLNSAYSYSDTVASGSFTVDNKYIGSTTNLTCTGTAPNKTANVQNLEQPSSLYWRSNMPKYAVKFVFRINDVPYDSLPETVNQLISLNGNEVLTFGKEGTNVVATGNATAGTHTLFLGGKNTGVTYTVTANANNTFYIDFYTLRVAAGTGIRSVSLQPASNTSGWNGTLPYVRDNKTSSDTLSVWPYSMSFTSGIDKINISARAEGEYQSLNNNNELVWGTSNYSFNRWDTKRPTSNISIQYANNSSTTTNVRETYVVVSGMNHATVVQAEATTEGTPIVIPEVPEHNSVYYGVKLRTFLDGRITNPWSGIKGYLTLANNTTHNGNLYSGVLTWSTCLDLVDKNGNAISDPYKGKSANASIAPSYEFESNANVNTAYFYNASNAYIANKYAYIDAFYYTQTIQTQVNGVNTLPFTQNKYKEVAYRQYYNDIQVDTTTYVYVNSAGAYQTVMLKDMNLSVWGKKLAHTNTSVTNTTYWQSQYTSVKIQGAQAYVIPYYTVTMKSVCDFKGTDITCPALTFNSSSAKSKTIVVMPGSYSISTSDTATTHSDGDSKHTFAGWELGTNEIFTLEYVDSEGENPYPVLTYTGEIRASESSIADTISSTTTVTISDETNLVARYTSANELYNLTLNNKFIDADGVEMQGALQVLDAETGLPVQNASVKYYDENGTLITITRSTESLQSLYTKTSDTGYSFIPMGAVKATVIISKNGEANSTSITFEPKKTINKTVALSNGTFTFKTVMPVDMYRSDNAGNKYSTFNGQSAKYAKDTIVNVDGTWHPIEVHYPKAISVTFTMKCPVCKQSTAYDSGNFTCTNCKHTVPLLGAPQANSKSIYYSTASNYSDIQTYIALASKMNADKAAEYLAQYGIVEMTRVSTGTYTGTLPYSENAYHLFIDGVRQGSQYDKYNTKTTQFVMSTTQHTCAWDGTAHMNSKADAQNSNCIACATNSNCGTPYSSFFVSMNKDRAYTAYAYQKTSGTEPTNQSIEFTYVSIYTNTDYTEKLPYSDTSVLVNGTRYVLQNNVHTCKNNQLCNGTHIMVPNNATLVLQAQRNAAGTYYEVFNKTFNAAQNQSVLLSYNSVTVELAPGFSGGINGTNATYAVYLANYAIDNGAFTSTNTTYTVGHTGQSLPNTTKYMLGMNFTVKAPAGYTLTLQPQTYKPQSGEVVAGPFTGVATTQYIYVLPNTPNNQDLLSDWSAVELQEGNYIVGISTDPNLTNGGSALGKNVVIQKDTCITFQPNTQYEIVVRQVSSTSTSATYQTDIIASPTNEFTAGYTNGVGYIFTNVPNGEYKLLINGVAIATNPSDFTNVNGVTINGTHIIISSEKSFNVSASQHSLWQNSETPGTPNTTLVNPGTVRNKHFSYSTVFCDASVSSPSTSTSYQNDHRHLLVGTDVWTQVTTSPDPTPSVSEGDVTVNFAAYRVETYVNNVLQTPFIAPVLFNDTILNITNGRSDIVFSVNAPIVAAKVDVHDTQYSRTYSANGARTDIVYDQTNRVFKVYYWTVTFGTLHDDIHLQCENCGLVCSGYHNAQCQGTHYVYHTDYACSNCGGKLFVDTLLGQIIHGDQCNETYNKAIVVLDGTSITQTVNNTVQVGNHIRTAVSNTPTGYKEPKFNGWVRYNDTNWTSQTLTSTINTSIHIDASWSSIPGEYKVTLYNNSNLQTLKLFVGPKQALQSTSKWTTLRTQMAGGTGNYSANAPDTLQKQYQYLALSTMTAYVQNPHIFSESSTTINVTLNLTGYTSERAHVVKLVNTSTGATYTKQVAANTFVANFTLPTGYYQLYIDDMKYSTPFSYSTHDTSCKVMDSNNNLITPYFENTGTRGVLYVAPVYNVRSFYISHWSEVRYNRITESYIEYSNVNCTDANCSGDANNHAGCDKALWTTIDSKLRPTYIKNYYLCDACGYTLTKPTSGITYSHITECPNCGSEYFRMTQSILRSPKIEEDLMYNVYTGHRDQAHTPLNLVLDVEMAYPVYVQTVVDGTNKLPFNNAQAKLQFSEDGSTWSTLTEAFDSTGKATFYVPMGTQYRVIGSSRDEWSTSVFTDGGWCISSTYTDAGVTYKTIGNVRYVWGDGDQNNDGVIDDPGTTYYVHYYTVTARTGSGTQNVSVLNSSDNKKTSPSIYDTASAINTNSASTSAVYQRGATAKVQAFVRPGYLPVAIQVTKDNNPYKGLSVYLSTSSTSNSEDYQLTYNSTTQRYEHNAVAGQSSDSGVTRYYVWADGNNGQSEYTGVYVDVTPYGGTLTWSGNCKCNTHTSPYNYQEECNSQCSSSSANHASFSVSGEMPYTHSFIVYHTTTETPTAERLEAIYTYRYADDHPLNPDDPNYDDDEPDDDDEHSENTVYYYTLTVTGDAGISQPIGSGTYLEGTKASINAVVQSQRTNIGRTPISVSLALDNTAWSGQTVTIGGYAAKETSAGVYTTDHYFASGTYAVVVTSSDITLLDNGATTNKTVYGYITVSSTRAYTWTWWTDGCIQCSSCGAIGQCCEPVGCNETTKYYCTNCHILIDDNMKEQSCCTITGKHAYTDCPYNSDVYGGACRDNLLSSYAVKSNSILMKHNSALHAVTTYHDTFKFTGDTHINFTTLHIYGDAGIDNVKIHGTTYQETTAISRHGKTALNGTTFNKELPDRIWTNTRYEYTFFKVVAAKNMQSVAISATTKTPVTNHAEAKTALAIELLIDGKPYTGRAVTIGGYAATDSNNDGIYVTSYSGFVGGKTYQIVVDGRNAGTIKLDSTRSYRFYMWDEPWTFNSGSTNGAYETDEHTCKYHGTTHTCEQCAGKVANYLSASTTVVVDDFPQLVARTEFVDEFVLTVSHNNTTEPDKEIEYYTVTVNTRLNNAATDDFPIKFENLTSGVTIYIIPDGQTYHVYDSTGKQITNVPYINSVVDGKVVISLQDGDKYRVSVLDEIEDATNNDTVDINDIKTSTLHQYTYTKHTENTIAGAAQTVTVDFYTLTLNVYSDGTQTLPIGKTVNDLLTNFEAPVWLDDVSSGAEGAKNWWGETTDSIGDTGYYAVGDAKTVKVYLKGQSYDVNAKTADDDSTSRTLTVGNGYLADHTSGTVGSSAVTVNVYYYSMTVDHHGGFKGTQINYGGKTHVSASTTAGATGNATAKAFFLSGTKIDINATLATNNTWYQWTGSATYSTQNQTSITMNQTRAESAWAKTFYTVRYYLHDKAEGWYQVKEDCITSSSSVVIDNRNWNSVTVTGEPNKYVNFDPFRTHSYSDPNATSMSDLHDALATGVVTTTIDVVINANQVGGQSFVDFYYTRNGSKVDPTPDTPTVPDVTPTPEEPTNPTPQKPEDWNPDKQQEYVTITYVMNGGKYNGSSSNYSETHYVGTDITLITPTPPAGKEFVGWFLTDYNTTTQSASGLIGTSADHYLLCQDTTVYAVYVGKTDLGITANDIYGSIKTGSQFTSSATIVNTNKLSITPNSHINAVLTIKKNGTTVDTITLTDVIVPGGSTGTPGTQMIYTVVDTTNWDANATYTLTWSLDFSKSLYVDSDSTNNTSSLNSFKPNTYSAVVNTARPGYSTDRPSSYDKDIDPMSTSNTAFNWEYWTWNEKNGYNGVFSKQTGSDKMNIVIMLTPENESGLRTYTTGALGMHNYTTRSGYGLSMHRVYNDLTASWPVNKSHLTVKSTVGTLEALMTFPEFNYNSTYKSANGTVQEYVKLTAANAGSYYSLTMPQYTDYETDDYNDQFAHYTPMWLPNGEYIPVTHISGLWTPIGELRATVQQGQYTDLSNMQKFGIYTNEIIIKGSLFDDLYNNP